MITQYADVFTIDSEKVLRGFFAVCVDAVGNAFHPDIDFREYKKENGRRVACPKIVRPLVPETSAGKPAIPVNPTPLSRRPRPPQHRRALRRRG